MTDLKQRAEALREAVSRHPDSTEYRAECGCCYLLNGKEDYEIIIKAAQTLLRVMEGMPIAEYPDNEDDSMCEGYASGFNACRAEILKLMGDN